MTTKTTNQHNSRITVGQFENERGITLDADKEMILSSYLKKSGLKELGKLLEKIEAA